jgi:benzoyl-CoA reductase/2-hydroxyglutaryl-CoA dehydratase subunit BcrC/BadD/HgdB
MNPFAKLAALADEPYRRTDDRPLIAVFPMWFPYEILLAGGLRASEWWGFPLATTLADAHFPPFVCTLVKANFEVLLDGAAAPDGMVFPSATCDSIQNSAGLFRRLHPGKFSAYFRMSQNPESGAAPSFLRDEIERLLRQVETFAGRKIAADDLRRAIAATNRLRRAVRKLLSKQAAGKIAAPARHVYAAIKGAVADVGETTAAWLEEFADSLTATPSGAKKLMLVGMTPEPTVALDLIENAGGRVVGDDLGLGWRTFAVDAAEDGDPVDALVNRLLHSPPCSSLHFDGKRRSDGVLARVRELQADAVVFTRVKFCDPEAFDYPNVKKALDEARVPSLLLERELVAGAEAATATRVEAFIEQLG